MRSPGKWQGKVVVVTGGGGGIGRAVSHQFAQEGASVVVVDRTFEISNLVCQEITNKGLSAIAMGADVSSEPDVRSVVQDTILQLGRIDVLVNNAAVCPQVRTTDMTLETWNQVITNNLTSVFLLCREAIPHMIRGGGGAVVNVSSVHALATLDGYSAYAASKGGIVAMSRAMALDFAKDKVRVNIVLPGAIHTPMLESSVKGLDTPREQIMQEWDAAQPIGRVGQPEEVAAVILFAASPDNSFMTGATLVVDGGMTIEL
ncbi:MAG: family oxidoreductase [Paenibacillus sp.]|nr:family oxidoreductase [Paenibacillus sp.]